MASLPEALRADSGLLVLVRGFLANHARLEGANRTDAGIIAGAARRWGGELSRHVLGEFAAAIFDPATGTLRLVNDTLGLAPLFYAATSDGIVFATRLEDLLRETGPGEVDEDYVADFLARGAASGERTPYGHARRVAPGESVSWRDGVVTRHACWPFAECTGLRLDSTDACRTSLRELLHEAVGATLPPGGPVWCELSGGLDSSTVLAIAAAGGRDVHAVSKVFPRTHSADERRWMRPVVAQTGSAWLQFDADRFRPFARLPESFIAEPSDRFVMEGMIRPYEDVLREHGAGILLTGQGGDAVFMGDGAGPYFLADLLRQARLGQLWRWLSALSRNAPERRSHLYWASRYAWRPLLRWRRGQVVEDFLHRTPLPTWIDREYAARRDLPGRRRAGGVPPGTKVAATSCLERVLAVAGGLTRFHNHPDATVELRHPLLYRPLIEFMLALPDEVRFSVREDRTLQRQAMAGLLPRQTLARTDKGGQDQLFYEGLEDGHAWQDMLTRDPLVVRRGYVDGRRWRHAVAQACLGRSPGIGDFLATATLEAWLQQLEAYKPQQPLVCGAGLA